jgi:hypothetical protein
VLFAVARLSGAVTCRLGKASTASCLNPCLCCCASTPQYRFNVNAREGKSERKFILEGEESLTAKREEEVADECFDLQWNVNSLVRHLPYLPSYSKAHLHFYICEMVGVLGNAQLHTI